MVVVVAAAVVVIVVFKLSVLLCSLLLPQFWKCLYLTYDVGAARVLIVTISLYCVTWC